MRRQDDLDAVAAIEPFGMMIHLFGQERHLVHEAPGLGEGAEMKDLADGIAVLDLGPAMQFPKRRHAARPRQSRDHLSPPAIGSPPAPRAGPARASKPRGRTSRV